MPRVSPEIELSKYDRERRLVTLQHIQSQSIRNRRKLESDGIGFGKALRHIAAEPVRTREYLLSASTIASLKRAAELGTAP